MRRVDRDDVHPRQHLIKAGQAAAGSLQAPATPAVDAAKVPNAQALGDAATGLKIDTADAIAEAIKRGENK